ncbi:hypothetical protein PI124_g21330 [Phytophthora idaei]|nr:hypothetical protein PI125_g23073 [Phytophthora idaei]KAG3128945.1 hypothetical protein PI126_g21170 [Phytophthora idaei]KAG3233603.1 hypothetical protein PI124_g21330 [Phytophthora idaei]
MFERVSKWLLNNDRPGADADRRRTVVGDGHRQWDEHREGIPPRRTTADKTAVEETTHEKAMAVETAHEKTNAKRPRLRRSGTMRPGTREPSSRGFTAQGTTAGEIETTDK